MADRTYETLKQYQPKSVTNLKKTLFIEATVDTSDTITIGEMTTITNASAYRVSDGSVADVTVNTNVLTVTEAAATDAEIVLMVVGS